MGRMAGSSAIRAGRGTGGVASVSANRLIAKVVVRERGGDGRQYAFARMRARQLQHPLQETNRADAACGERGIRPLAECGADAFALPQ